MVAVVTLVALAAKGCGQPNIAGINEHTAEVQMMGIEYGYPVSFVWMGVLTTRIRNQSKGFVERRMQDEACPLFFD